LLTSIEFIVFTVLPALKYLEIFRHIFNTSHSINQLIIEGINVISSLQYHLKQNFKVSKTQTRRK
jgi:hypothetical protein